MKKFLSIICLLSTPAFADTIQTSAGGTILNSSNTVVTGEFDYVHQRSPDSHWRVSFDADYAYNDSHGLLLRDQLYTIGKLDYNLDNRNYLQATGRYEFNQLGVYKNKVVIGLGHGYRLIRNRNLKVSLETSVGMTESKGLNEFVVRESIWANYHIDDKLSVEEKFLIEHGSHDYIRNKAAVIYHVNKHAFVSVTNIYTDDYVVSKLTSFNIGYKF